MKLATRPSKDARIDLRVNLRPYQNRGGTESALLLQYLHGTQTTGENPDRFRREWLSLGTLLGKTKLLHARHKEWEKFDKRMSPAYPFRDHSEAYIKTYKPAYCVISYADWLKIAPASQHWH